MRSSRPTIVLAIAALAGAALLTQAMAEPVRAPDKPVNSLQEMYAALRACWQPPPIHESMPGMEMSVRFSFKRDGELLGPLRVTYSRADADDDTRRAYGAAIAAAFKRCTPMPFTDQMGGAIAGQPISIRFIDTRGQKKA